MRAATRLEYSELLQHSLESLEKLGFQYRKNQAEGVTEFEIISPARFRVLLEQGLREETRNVLLASDKNVCWVEVVPDLEASESAELVRKSALAFVAELGSSFPGKPWNGFGFLRGRRERKRWTELGRL